jgi:hypothetical protein
MYRRQVRPAVALTGDALTAAMVGIGMNFAAKGARNPNIEDTLLFASKEALDKDDLRVLSVLVTWLGIHANWINADRLIRLVAEEEGPRVRSFWAAVGHWLKTDRRYVRLSILYRGQRLDLLRTGTEYQVSRHGEDLRFQGSPLRVPANLLRDRAADVLTPAALAKQHRTYRQRVMMGPSYRADMWAALQADPFLSAADLARTAYGSFATAWQVKRDWELLKGSLSIPHRG